ncbi:MAG: methyltransferase, partial [Candidatus Eiseniibacteriota bacterium]
PVAGPPAGGPERRATLPPEIAEFGTHHRGAMRRWQAELAEMGPDRRRTVAWGSGCKALNFLNALETAGRIEYVVDINPERQGRFIPGAGQEVVAPGFLVSYRPQQVIVTNPLYEREIRDTVAGLGLDCAFTTL